MMLLSATCSVDFAITISINLSEVHFSASARAVNSDRNLHFVLSLRNTAGSEGSARPWQSPSRRRLRAKGTRQGKLRLGDQTLLLAPDQDEPSSEDSDCHDQENQAARS